MGNMPGRGASSNGGNLQTQNIGDSVSDSCSVNRESTTIDHVNNLPMLILKSRQSSHAVGQAFPIWSLVEVSHPSAQFSSCRTDLVQGGGGARDSDASRKASFDVRPPSIEQSGASNYFIAAYILLLNVCQWSSQPSQRALITISGAHLCQFTAKLLKNICFEPRSAALCWCTMELV